VVAAFLVVAAPTQRRIQAARPFLLVLVRLVDLEIGGGGVVEDQIDIEPEQVGGAEEDVALACSASSRNSRRYSTPCCSKSRRKISPQASPWRRQSRAAPCRRRPPRSWPRHRAAWLLPGARARTGARGPARTRSGRSQSAG